MSAGKFNFSKTELAKALSSTGVAESFAAVVLSVKVTLTPEASFENILFIISSDGVTLLFVLVFSAFELLLGLFSGAGLFSGLLFPVLSLFPGFTSVPALLLVPAFALPSLFGFTSVPALLLVPAFVPALLLVPALVPALLLAPAFVLALLLVPALLELVLDIMLLGK